MSVPLAAAVGVVAFLYSSVGHAGATGYIAVLTLAGLPPAVIRPTALVLNVIVATIGTAAFARAGHFRSALFLPLAVASVPCAALGGSITLPTVAFERALAVVLLASAARLVGQARHPQSPPVALPGRLGRRARRSVILAALGAGIGLLSGLTGVGGGVFLSPVLLALDVAPLKTVAATSAAFILVNSLAGLAGGIAAGRGFGEAGPSLVAAAALGGLAGSVSGAFRLPVPMLRLLLAAVLVVAGVKLLG